MGIAGVFSEEGKGWRRGRPCDCRRAELKPPTALLHIITTATERLYRRLTVVAKEGRSIDITGELTSLTVDVTSALAFGHDLNTLEGGDVGVQIHIRRVSRRFPGGCWLRSRLGVMCGCLADRALDRSLVRLHEAVRGFIEQARQRMRDRPELYEAPKNFLEGMLAAQESEGTFTDEEVIGNALTLLLAGEDTTAHTMAWTLWFLAQHNDIQERWAQEAQEVLGEQRFPDDYDAMAKLSYGEAVLRESMRLKPVAVALTVESVSDMTSAGTLIPAGLACGSRPAAPACRPCSEQTRSIQSVGSRTARTPVVHPTRSRFSRSAQAHASAPDATSRSLSQRPRWR